MSKKTESPKTTKPYKTTRLEVAKTVLISILVTAIVAFALGVRYEQSNEAQRVDITVHEAVQTIEDATPAKK